MQTLINKIDDSIYLNSDIEHAAELLKTGHLVVFPTETVFGLGADATNDEACLSIFRAKNRPADNPLILHLASVAQFSAYATEIPEYAYRLMDHFCPGPLTFLFHRSNIVSQVVTAGQSSVCLRVPSHPVAQALLQSFGGAIAAPSANTSTRPSATTARDAFEDLKGKVALILDSDIPPQGIESTILDCRGEEPRILRQGVISAASIAEVSGMDVISSISPNNKERLVTPGSKYKHYAPNLEVVAFSREAIMNGKLKMYFDQIKSVKKLRFLSNELLGFVPETNQVLLPTKVDFAARLFREFRQAERDGIEVLFVELLDEEGLGAGVNERVRKAATVFLT